MFSCVPPILRPVTTRPCSVSLVPFLTGFNEALHRAIARPLVQPSRTNQRTTRRASPSFCAEVPHKPAGSPGARSVQRPSLRPVPWRRPLPPPSPCRATHATTLAKTAAIALPEGLKVALLPCKIQATQTAQETGRDGTGQDGT